KIDHSTMVGTHSSTFPQPGVWAPTFAGVTIAFIGVGREAMSRANRGPIIKRGGAAAPFAATVVPHPGTHSFRPQIRPRDSWSHSRYATDYQLRFISIRARLRGVLNWPTRGEMGGSVRPEPPKPTGEPDRVVTSRSLLGGDRQVIIEHGTER